MLICGIDPGAKGGVAFAKIYPSMTPVVSVHRMPEVGGKFSARTLSDMLKAMHPDVVYLEDVWSNPKWAHHTSFAFGKNVGIITGIVESLGIRLELVPAKTWQKVGHFGIPKNVDTKERSFRALAQLYPDLDLTPGKCRTPQDGMADAALIAHYGQFVERRKSK